MGKIEYDNPLKIYVEVTAKFSPEGEIMPVSFVFEDGNDDHIADENQQI